MERQKDTAMEDAVSEREGRLPPASGILIYLLLLVCLATVFGLWPQIDLAVASFAREISGGRFQFSDGWWYWLYAGTRPVFMWLSAIVAALGLYAWYRRRPVLGVTPRIALFILLAFLVTQALVIDVYLKIAFGRARPRDLVEFGGTLVFTPFYVVSDQCARNCSFVSGHAGMAFALFALVFVAAERWRRRLFWAVLAFGLVMSWMRIVQGAHFLSDVLFSGLVVYGVTWFLHLVMLRPAVWPRPWWRARRRQTGSGAVRGRAAARG